MRRFINGTISKEKMSQYGRLAISDNPVIAIIPLIKTMAWNTNAQTGKIVTIIGNDNIERCISWYFNSDLDSLTIWEWCNYNPCGIDIDFTKSAIEYNAPGKRVYVIHDGDSSADIDTGVLWMIIRAINLACR